jgi:hypothetical protein
MYAQLGPSFNIALCEHLGLSPKRVLDVKVKTEADEAFAATFTVSLMPEDLAAVAERMGAKREAGPTLGGVTRTFHVDAIGMSGCKASAATCGP